MKILNIGSINIDRSYRVKHIAKPKETISALDYHQSFGGKGLNQSIAMARAGAEVWQAGFIGSDGEELLAVMRSEGLHLDYLRKMDCPTGHAIIQIDENAQNCIMIHAGANSGVSRDYIDMVLGDFGRGDYLLLQNEVPNVDYAIRQAHDKGMIVFLNPSPIESARDIANIELVDFLILNEVEGQILSGKSGFEDILNALRERYENTTVVLTVGDQGVLCRDGSGTYAHGCYRVEAVDTTAAGDTFTGYFISAISRNVSVPEALKLASLAGAICVSRQGTIMSIPYLNEVKEFGASARIV